MNILVIGGSRFIGPLIIEELSRCNHNVTVFNRGQISQSYPKGIRFIKGDRNNGFKFKEHFDVVIDTCAYNGAQTKKALEELSFDFFIHMSTAAVYWGSEILPYFEDSPLDDWTLRDDYQRGKVECERALNQSSVKYASIRSVYILGPRNYREREHFIYSKIKRKEPIVIPGNGQTLIQFVFASDVAKAIVSATERKIDGIFNCAGDEIITLKGLVEEMARITGQEPVIRYDHEADGPKFNKPEFPFANKNLIVSNGKIKKLGIKFLPLLDGLKEDYENYYKYVI